MDLMTHKFTASAKEMAAVAERIAGGSGAVVQQMSDAVERIGDSAEAAARTGRELEKCADGVARTARSANEGMKAFSDAMKQGTRSARDLGNVLGRAEGSVEPLERKLAIAEERPSG